MSPLIVAGILSFLVAATKLRYDNTHFFYISCPVCHHKATFYIARLHANVNGMSLEDFGKITTKCKGELYADGNWNKCGADLTGLYLMHPLVRETIANKHKLELAKEESKAFIASLQEQRDAVQEAMKVE